MSTIRTVLTYVGVTFWVILGYNHKARGLLKKLLERQRNDVRSTPSQIAQTISELVYLPASDDRERREDNALIREALALLQSINEFDCCRVASLLAVLGNNEEKQGNAASAIQALERSLQIFDSDERYHTPRTLIYVLEPLARLYEQMGGMVERVQELRGRLEEQYHHELQEAILYATMRPFGPP